MKAKNSSSGFWVIILLPSLLLHPPSFSDIHYVGSGGGNTSPYTNWAMAAHVIQDAVDAAASGDTVLVSNGVYNAGGATIYGMSNRVALTKAITMRSVNGRDVTSIVGVGPNGASAVRCLYLTNGVSVTGFTLTNGHTQISFWSGTGLVGGVWMDSGGGAWLDAGGTISGCTIRANSARGKGGGIYFSRGGKVRNSLITDNRGDSILGGGVYIEEQGWLLGCSIISNTVTGMGSAGGIYCKNGGVVSNCTINENRANIVAGMRCYGGGLVTDCEISDNVNTRGGYGFTGGLSINVGVTVNNCIISGNTAGSDGGGVSLSGGTLNNCLIRNNKVDGNSASPEGGGGVYISGSGTVKNCTITANHSAVGGGGVFCNGGVTLQNCIIYANSAYSYSGDLGTNWFGSGATFEYTCTTPLAGLPGGAGCIDDNPQFAAAYRLQAASPCIDTGNNAYLPGVPDLDGVPRPLDGDNDGTVTADMGCYEYLNAAADSDDDGLLDGEEVNTYGTDPTNADTDGDNCTDYQEKVADTDGTDSNDFFAVNAITIHSPVTVRFDSSMIRLYTLIQCENPINGIWTNVPGFGPRFGIGSIDSFVVTNNNPYCSYGVKVEIP